MTTEENTIGLPERNLEGRVMHLRFLALHGFKSFALPTLLRFDRGTTALVGPNGSGKSNLADAVLWALGEDDPDALRIADERDLLFAGTREHPPAQACFVDLEFENADRRIPLPADTVVVRRQMAGRRTQYVVNGTRQEGAAVRRMLADAGLALPSRAVVRQGQLEAVLSSGGGELAALAADHREGDGGWVAGLSDAFAASYAALCPTGEARLVRDERRNGPAVRALVQPAGKPTSSAAALSGGERAIAALALRIALWQRFPGPLLILDEIEPALDEANTRLVHAALGEVGRRSQIFLITHNPWAKEHVALLYGMGRWAGCSRVRYRYERATGRLINYGARGGNWIEKHGHALGLTDDPDQDEACCEAGAAFSRPSGPESDEGCACGGESAGEPVNG